jgi:hypothetical protein
VDESKDTNADKPKMSVGKADGKSKKKMAGTTFVGHKMCDNPDSKFEDLKKNCADEGYTISDSTIKTVMSDVGKILSYLRETGKIE